MPCMKMIYRDKKRRRSTGQQPGTKSAHGPADKPLINRSSTARQPLVVFPLPPKGRPGRLSSVPWAGRMDGCPLDAPTRRRPIPPCPAALRPARSAPPVCSLTAVGRPDSPRHGKSGFWTRQFLSPLANSIMILGLKKSGGLVLYNPE